jgi:hypothetical protein
MDVLLVLVVIAVAILLITGPLRSGARTHEDGEPGARADLEAAKEAKYKEIRDAELDFRTGKLSREDWQRLDSALRAEAVELLHGLDALDSEPARPGQPEREE